MGWQERDWARWTDEERSRFVGSSPAVRSGAFVAVVVSLVATVVLAGAPGIQLLQRHHTPSIPPLYGSGTVVLFAGHDGTCTEIQNGACTTYTPIEPGQRVLPAAPPPAGTSCPLLEVDQASGSWVCGVTANS